jgi:murein DD-endopeptidase MepM/ murein hydrolase activator NlpD
VEEVYPDGRIRISESNWAGQGISQRTLTPAQYSGLEFVRLENATPNPNFSSPPARSGQQREYRVRSGDTLSAIAYRELGNPNRWREITKADSSTFTEAEARQLQVGMSVYLPVSYQTGSGTGVTSSPTTTPTLLPDINTLSLSAPGTNLGATYRIGTPTRPDYSWGRGYGDLPKKQAEWHDYVREATFRTIAQGFSLLYPDGVGAYLHYLDGNGAERTFSYEEYVNNDQSGRTTMDNVLLDAKSAAEQIYQQAVSQYPALANREVTFNLTSNAYAAGAKKSNGEDLNPKLPYPETTNWQAAIGSHLVWISASVTVLPNQSPVYKMDFELHVEDKYDFNPGQRAGRGLGGINDSENGRLEEVGLAHSYINKATLPGNRIWTQGQGFRTLIP